jgi:hypothetical protein
MTNQELQALSDDIRAKFEISDEVLRMLSQNTALSGAKEIAFTIPIKGGAGQGMSTMFTGYVTLTGYGVITTPSIGSWHIVARQNGNVFIDQINVQSNQYILFTTGTRLSTTFEIEATWSKKADTTLQVKLHVTY